MKLIVVAKALSVSLLLAATSAYADYQFSFNPFTVTAPDNRSFGNSTNASVNPVGTLAALAPPNFLDSWLFELTNTAAIGSFVGSLNFTDGIGGPVTQGISNLELRLVGPGGTVYGMGSVLNIPVSPAQQQLFSVVAQNGSFDPGLYSLEVRGALVGSYSAYAGTLNAMPAAVPLPAALPLLMVGLGLIGLC